MPQFERPFNSIEELHATELDWFGRMIQSEMGAEVAVPAAMHYCITHKLDVPQHIAAFSVELPFRNLGIGNELMGRVIRAARNRGVRLLYMSCLAENRKMQAIARKHSAALRFEYGEVVGDIVPKESNYFSVLAEAVEDRVGYMLAVLDLQDRIVKAA